MVTSPFSTSGSSRAHRLRKQRYRRAEAVVAQLEVAARRRAEHDVVEYEARGGAHSATRRRDERHGEFRTADPRPGANGIAHQPAARPGCVHVERGGLRRTSRLAGSAHQADARGVDPRQRLHRRLGRRGRAEREPHA
ncbi:MAG: hypothetical protein ACXVRH_02585, partial [Thermoleophilaceae bacterium]